MIVNTLQRMMFDACINQIPSPDCKIHCLLIISVYLREMGKVMREEAEKQAQLLKEGHTLYQEYVQRGQQSRKEKEVRKTFLLCVFPLQSKTRLCI